MDPSVKYFLLIKLKFKELIQCKEYHRKHVADECKSGIPLMNIIYFL